MTMMESNLAQDATAEEDENTEKITLFLAVPAEIRNKIYRYALVQAEREQRSGHRICGLSQPALTRANKQIRSEALPIYYGQKSFQLNISSSMGEGVPNDWSSFVRMFSVFKAGRTGGWGTGSLRFIQDIECRIDCPRISSRWTPTVAFKADSEPHENSCTGSTLGDIGIGKRKGSTAWHDWKSVHKYVNTSLLPEYPFSASTDCQIPDVVYMYRECMYREYDFSPSTNGQIPDVLYVNRKSRFSASTNGHNIDAICMDRLISTVVMVARECTAATKDVRITFAYRGDRTFNRW